MRISRVFEILKQTRRLTGAWRSGSPDPIRRPGKTAPNFICTGAARSSMLFCRCSGDEPGCARRSSGEFARRAFINGKMDLSQAEALADLIDAQTEFQRRQALRVAGGALRRQVEDWRAGLVEASALLVAELDFSDEGDVGSFSPDALGRVLRPLKARMENVLRCAPASERLRDGFLVLILRSSQRRQVDAA